MVIAQNVQREPGETADDKADGAARCLERGAWRRAIELIIGRTARSAPEAGKVLPCPSSASSSTVRLQVGLRISGRPMGARSLGVPHEASRRPISQRCPLLPHRSLQPPRFAVRRTGCARIVLELAHAIMGPPSAKHKKKGRMPSKASESRRRCCVLFAFTHPFRSRRGHLPTSLPA